MKSKDNWIKKYPMMDYQKIDCKKIRNSVGEKILKQKGEVIIMKHRKFKTLAIVGAVMAASAASIFTVNAATDGAVVKTVKEWIANVTVFIDGKEVEVPAKMKKIEGNDDYMECEIELEVDDGDGDNEQHIFIYEEGDAEKPLMEIFDSRYKTDSSEIIDPSDFEATDSENK